MTALDDRMALLQRLLEQGAEGAPNNVYGNYNGVVRPALAAPVSSGAKDLSQAWLDYAGANANAQTKRLPALAQALAAENYIRQMNLDRDEAIAEAKRGRGGGSGGGGGRSKEPVVYSSPEMYDDSWWDALFDDGDYAPPRPYGRPVDPAEAARASMMTGGSLPGGGQSSGTRRPATTGRRGSGRYLS